MTLDNLERQNGGFYGFFGDFGLQDTFHERTAPKSIEIDRDKLHMKFSALNVDFDSPSLDFLGSRKPIYLAPYSHSTSVTDIRTDDNHDKGPTLSLQLSSSNAGQGSF